MKTKLMSYKFPGNVQVIEREMNMMNFSVSDTG